MKARCPLVPYQPAIVKQYWPMNVRRSAFGVRRSAFGVRRSALRRCGVAAFGVPRSAFSGRNHIEVESVPMSLFNPFIVIGL
jgi:hypothetical protein